MNTNHSVQFISSLAKFLQNLCNGYVEFEKYVLVTGHLYVTVDTGENVEYVVNEKMCKSEEKGINVLSNSFHISKEKNDELQKNANILSNIKSETPEDPVELLEAVSNGCAMSDRITVDDNYLMEICEDEEVSTNFSMLDEKSRTREKSKIQADEFQDLFPKIEEFSTDEKMITKSTKSPGEFQGKDVLLAEVNSSVDMKKDTDACDSQKCDLQGTRPKKPRKKRVDKRKNRIRTKKHKPGIPKYKCEVCNKKLCTPKTFEVHMRSHTGEKPYICDVCGKSYTSPHILKTHKITHLAEKPFTCRTCGMGFTQKGNLKSHERRHTGERPYVCDNCGKDFVQLSSLLSHKMFHSDEKPFKCGKCDYATKTKKALARHQSVHTGEKPCKCPYCGKMFSKNGIVKHKMTHTGEKPCICETCGQGFALRATLIAHERRHTGERPFECEVCGKRFTQKSALRTHKRQHEKVSQAREVRPGQAARVMEHETGQMRINPTVEATGSNIDTNNKPKKLPALIPQFSPSLAQPDMNFYGFHMFNALQSIDMKTSGSKHD